MELIELGAVLGAFFDDGDGPSHDQLDQAFARAHLAAGDPAPGGRTSQGKLLGKAKRLRQVLVYATDHDVSGGLKLAQHVVALLRADGAFASALPTYAGTAKIERLRSAYAALGYALDSAGALRPLVLDNLTGTAMTEALRSYINRVNLNPDDAALLVGTGKELDEAAARHVLVERLGSYATGGAAGSFPVTLANAFTALGMSVPNSIDLDTDPHKAVQHSLFLLGIAVNRLRNEVGTGHGRPGQPVKTQPLMPAEARLVARTSALLAGALLDGLAH